MCASRLARIARIARVSLAVVLALGLWPGATTLAANRDALRTIVQAQCLPHWLQDHDPAPCRSVELPSRDDAGHGYALLHDILGGAHYLLIAAGDVSGVESPSLYQPGSPNFFAAAWQAREALAAELGRPVPDEAVALAVNSQRARTQDRLHVHISCQLPAVHDALARLAGRIGTDWTPVLLSTGPYQALRVMGTSLDGHDPFALLARLPGSEQDRGGHVLLVAAMRFDEGPGFIVLTGVDVPGSAMLLDDQCALAR
jgi:CDP-diacylglycerol pyrophosphatase